MDYINYKKISTSTSALKKDAEEFRKITVQEEQLDEYLRQQEKQFKYGFWLFCGMILFGIVKYFFFGEDKKTSKKKSAAKNKCASVNFNFIKI